MARAQPGFLFASVPGTGEHRATHVALISTFQLAVLRERREERPLSGGRGLSHQRSLRVAVTSRDGVSVNERFHRALDDLIFDVDLRLLAGGAEEGPEAVRFVERRPRPETSARAQRDFDAIGEGLSDCRVLLSLEFTGAARKALTGKGFAVHQGRGEISAYLREILTQISTGPGRPSRAPSEE